MKNDSSTLTSVFCGALLGQRAHGKKAEALTVRNL